MVVSFGGGGCLGGGGFALAGAGECGLGCVLAVSAELQGGGGGAPRDKEELSRLEVVQRLAKDGCRFLQGHNSKTPERTLQVSERYSTRSQRKAAWLVSYGISKVTAYMCERPSGCCSNRSLTSTL